MRTTPLTDAAHCGDLSVGIQPTITTWQEAAAFARTLEYKLQDALAELDVARKQIKPNQKIWITKSGFDYWLHIDVPRTKQRASINLGPRNGGGIVDSVVQEAADKDALTALEAFGAFNIEAIREAAKAVPPIPAILRQAVLNNEAQDPPVKQATGEELITKPCECLNWCHNNLTHVLLTGHHERCEHSPDALEKALELIANLTKGIEEWSAQEDGVPDFVWDAYSRAKTLRDLGFVRHDTPPLKL